MRIRGKKLKFNPTNQTNYNHTTLYLYYTCNTPSHYVCIATLSLSFFWFMKGFQKVVDKKELSDIEIILFDRTLPSLTLKKEPRRLRPYRLACLQGSRFCQRLVSA